MQQPALLALVYLLLASLGGCVEPFAPAVISAPPRLLVVDGFINARGVSIIRLSRSVALDAKTIPPIETKARLVIEEQNGATYSLMETTPGTYVSAALTLAAGRAYRLHISTAAGLQYASDFVAAQLTPAIDAVDWRPETEGVGLLVSTHDESRASQYYRWEYDETWQIRSPYQPAIEYSNGALRLIRSPYPYPDFCWSTEFSTRILLSQSTALAEDRITGFRLLNLPLNSSRLYIRYSLLVRQQALSKEEYAYWNLLRKNTENIGSLFDAQPSQLTGNVHSLDDGQEQVLGFVGVHSVSEKRLFIDRAELPNSIRPLSGYESCLPPDTLKPYEGDPPPSPAEVAATLFNAFNSQQNLPIVGARGGILYKNRDCVDCRTRGTAVRPSFW